MKLTILPLDVVDGLQYGQYYVSVSVGTPPQPLDLIVDDGENTIWIFDIAACTYNHPLSCSGSSCRSPDPLYLLVFPKTRQTPLARFS